MNMLDDEIFESLKKAILKYDGEGAANLAREVVKRGMNLLKALDALTEAIREVGDGYARGELWLPDLIGAANAMQSATPIIEEEMKRKGMKKEIIGTVVIGTVYGDIHSIGKTMVSTLLTAHGFAVNDLGVNITTEKFVEAIKKYNANILAMSALMTTTAPEQEKVIATLKKEKLRDKVEIMVGGGGITQEFADSIGADGYSPTAIGGVELAKSLVRK